MDGWAPIFSWVGISLVVIFLLVLLFRSIVRFIPDYKRLGVYRGGVFIGDKGPGLYLTIPFLDKCRYSDSRSQLVEIDRHQFVSRDGKPVTLGLVSMYVVENAYEYFNRIVNFDKVFRTLMISAVTMKVVKHDRVDVLPKIDVIAEEAQTHLQSLLSNWGVKIQTFEFVDLSINDEN
jgi:regulator of protease activity HflC (stomatin/prohibitin superfamily)